LALHIERENALAVRFWWRWTLRSVLRHAFQRRGAAASPTLALRSRARRIKPPRHVRGELIKLATPTA